MMDFVFSESEEGGTYDNRNGMDYHVPVSDSMAKEPPMHIVHIAVEMAPVAKVNVLLTIFFLYTMMTCMLNNDQFCHRLGVLAMLLLVFHELFKI